MQHVTLEPNRSFVNTEPIIIVKGRDQRDLRLDISNLIFKISMKILLVSAQRLSETDLQTVASNSFFNRLASFDLSPHTSCG